MKEKRDKQREEISKGEAFRNQQLQEQRELVWKEVANYGRSETRAERRREETNAAQRRGEETNSGPWEREPLMEVEEWE